jgi:hypothetical protein
MLTFQEFQATRRWADYLCSVDGIDLGYDQPVPGFHYHGGLHILANEGGTIPLLYELADGNWVEITAKEFELVIGNISEVSHDLTALEEKLYAWGKDEGAIG